MSPTFWLAAAIIHAVLVAAAAVAVCRVAGYKTSQRVLQIVIALSLPILGAIVVLAAAKAAVAEPAEPSNSGFDPQSYNAD